VDIEDDRLIALSRVFNDLIFHFLINVFHVLQVFLIRKQALSFDVILLHLTDTLHMQSISLSYSAVLVDTLAMMGAIVRLALLDLFGLFILRRLSTELFRLVLLLEALRLHSVVARVHHASELVPLSLSHLVRAVSVHKLINSQEPSTHSDDY